MVVWNHPLVLKENLAEELKEGDLENSKFERMVLSRKLETSLMMVMMNTMLGL